jgi:hypothetical protein
MNYLTDVQGNRKVRGGTHSQAKRFGSSVADATRISSSRTSPALRAGLRSEAATRRWADPNLNAAIRDESSPAKLSALKILL